MNESIDVVIVNWKRGKNIPPIVAAFKQQTIQCRIIVCDVSNGESPISDEALANVDEIFRWSYNYGSFNRYIPALSFRSEYIWFHDDDMIPGSRLLEFMLDCSARPFSVLGQSGRRVDGANYEFIQPGKDFQSVDVVCRGYWVKKKHLHYLMKFVLELSQYPIKKNVDIYRNDDMLLCQSLYQATHLPALVTPCPPKEALMNQEELPSPHGVCSRPGHMASRFATMDHLKSLKFSKQGRIFVVTTPPPSWRNIGDHAQLLGLQLLLRKYAGERQVIMLDKDHSSSSTRYDINSNDVIICQPGGNLGDRGIWSESGRRHFIQRYKQTKIVVLPQTIFFSDTVKGRETESKTCEIYNDHPNLHVYARDHHSQENAKRMFVNARCTEPAPDLALALDGYFTLSNCPPQDPPILLCIRDDNETRFAKKDVKSVLGEFSNRTIERSTVDKLDITEGVREWVIEQKLKEFQQSSLILTDRLHAVIFSYLSRKPCIALPNIDHKVHATIDAWFKDVPWIEKIDSPRDIAAAINKMGQYANCQLHGLDFHSPLELLIQDSLST